MMGEMRCEPLHSAAVNEPIRDVTEGFPGRGLFKVICKKQEVLIQKEEKVESCFQIKGKNI